MNSNKWRIIELPKELVEDLIIAHLYNMRGMTKREIIEINMPLWEHIEYVKVKIKMKEDKLVDQSSEKK